MESFQNHSELKALISLLDEDDEENLLQIKKKIHSYGINAISSLEDAREQAIDIKYQKRIEQIIHQIRYENIRQEILNWVSLGGTNLLTGAILVAKYQYPYLEEDKIKEQIEIYKRDVWLELNSNLTALERVKVLNHIIYEVHKFHGTKGNINAVIHTYINQLLSTKIGNPISLGVLYLILSQHFNLPVFGIIFPSMFVLAYTNEDEEQQISFIDKKEVLFYINPFSKGAVFTKNEVNIYLKNIGSQKLAHHFKHCNNIDIIMHMLSKLMLGYKFIGHQQKVEEIVGIWKAIKAIRSK